MKLLIVEDEARMADLLRKGLTEEGHYGPFLRKAQTT